jgi:glutathione synthase/RimK-type ligase-like ATP-grasp enzyme
MPKKKLGRRVNRRGYLRVFSRHPSHRPFRNRIRVSEPTCIRFGSVTESNDAVQYNSPIAVRRSSDKLLMKIAWGDNEFTPRFAYMLEDDMWRYRGEDITTEQLYENLRFPILIKRQFRSRGQGMRKLDTIEDLQAQMPRIRRTFGTSNEYYIEQFHAYSKEYRIHLGPDRAFYSCRKALRTEAENRWYRNDSNSVWFTQFDANGNLKADFLQPENWQQICDTCMDFKNEIGLDFGAVDLIVANDGRFKILEINSAPSFGEITLEKYIEELTRYV